MSSRFPILLLAAALPALAQTGRARIRVTDEKGAVVRSAKGELLGPDNQRLRILTGNDDGDILIDNLPVGDQQVMMNTPGFHGKLVTLPVLNGKEVRAEAVLEAGADLPYIRVPADSPQLVRVDLSVPDLERTSQERFAQERQANKKSLKDRLWLKKLPWRK